MLPSQSASDFQTGIRQHTELQRIKVDRRFLKLRPDPCGPQHDAMEPGYFGGHVVVDQNVARDRSERNIAPVSVSKVCREKGPTFLRCATVSACKSFKARKAQTVLSTRPVAFSSLAWARTEAEASAAASVFLCDRNNEA